MDISPSLLAVALSWRTLLDIILITTGMFFLLLTLARLGTWKIMAGIFLALVVLILVSHWCSVPLLVALVLVSHWCPVPTLVALALVSR